MDKKSERPVPKRTMRRWMSYLLLTLLAGLGLAALLDWQLGWATMATVLGGLVAIVLATSIALRFRTLAGRFAAVLAGLLCFVISFVGHEAIHATVLDRYGRQTSAVVTAAHPRQGKQNPYCRLRGDGGRDLPNRLTPCGYQVGDRVDVTYDPDGRQAPIEGAPAPAALVHWAGGLLAGLALLVLSLPLWAARGRYRPLRTQ